MRHGEKMAAIDEQIKVKEEHVRKIELDLEKVRGELNGLYMAKNLISGKTVQSDKPIRKRTPIKALALQILEDCGRDGADANKIVDIADKQHGIALKRGSVSSLLSRLAHDGVLHYDQDKYRLKEFAANDTEETPSNDEKAAFDPLVSLRASGVLQ